MSIQIYYLVNYQYKINFCRDNIHPKDLQKTLHHFELYTFTQRTKCYYCHKYLKGLLYQGYKCTNCGKSVHKKCIQFNCGKCEKLSQPPTNGSISRYLIKEPWFVGEMDRNTAAAKLERRENGTFLVRIRQNDENDKYALTLK